MEAVVDFPPTRALKHVLYVATSSGRIAVANEYFEVLAGELGTKTISSLAKPEASMLHFASPATELWYLKEQYDAIRLYRNWSFGPDVRLRRPCDADGCGRFLDEDGGNLALVLSAFHGDDKRAVLDALRSLYDGIVDFRCPVRGGTVGLFLDEKGNRTIERLAAL